MAVNTTQKLDKRWQQVIEYLELPGYRGMFLLGNFARRVTVYSQQVRALNLVDALAGLGRISSRTNLAVVGAGMGGLTACAALSSLGVPVTIYDTESDPMNLQRNCQTRFLHPHIYDWPLTRIDDTRAGLPVLDWEAGNADEVARKILAEWKELKGINAKEQFGCKVQKLDFDRGGWRLQFGEGRPDATHDLVVLALGYGVEKNLGFSYPYWDNLPL
jgi:cation diffusion facilitator CzcD-associated flavoprotein CzcO